MDEKDEATIPTRISPAALLEIPYTPDLYQQKCEEVYQHVFDSYPRRRQELVRLKDKSLYLQSGLVPCSLQSRRNARKMLLTNHFRFVPLIFYLCD
jgi:hypothetical protein